VLRLSRASAYETFSGHFQNKKRQPALLTQQLLKHSSCTDTLLFEAASDLLNSLKNVATKSNNAI
jgi:hypothetical protein